jgi:hypothetical protein
MPLPMVHLAIAVRLGEIWREVDSPDFLLGCLAPDAIHARTGAGEAEKAVTHFRDAEGEFDLARIQDMFSENVQKEGKLASFSAGYTAHLLSDHLWLTTVTARFKETLGTLDFEVGRAIYYEETDQLDFDLYRRMEWRPRVWEQLRQTDAPDFLPLLTATEIDAWRNKTLRWFDELKEEPKITPKYFTYEVTMDYIQRAVKMLAGLRTRERL